MLKIQRVQKTHRLRHKGLFATHQSFLRSKLSVNHLHTQPHLSIHIYLLYTTYNTKNLNNTDFKV